MTTASGPGATVTTGTVVTKAAANKAPSLPLNAGQSIEFYAELATNPAENEVLRVLAGEGAPTVTGGYAKHNVIDRPQRIGLTVLQGYDPISLKVPVLFTTLTQDGSWDAGEDAGLHIEIDCQKLEWMAGRGVGSVAATGDPPIVFATTTDAHGTTVPLIPFNWQQTSGKVNGHLSDPFPSPWVISDLTWDENPIRNTHGYRTRQAATVTLLEKTQTAEDAATSAAQRATNTKGSKGKTTTFVSRAGADTCLLIAKAKGARDIARAGEEIKKANPGLHIRSASRSVIKHNTRVKVPVVL